MQSRRDQVQAYFFVVGRMVSAVTHGRPDALVAPNRRLSTGTVLGVLLAALIAAVFGIYGLFVPGGDTSWRAPGAVVAVEDTGARFLYLDGQLRPVLNYASARLAGAGASPVVSVAQSSVAGVPVGRPIGIPGAPDALPAAKNLDPGPWTVCARPPESAAGGTPTVTLLLGRSPGTVLGDDQGLLVATPDDTRYLLWQGRRHRLTDPAVVQVLGYGRTTPVPVTPAWLNPIPVGRDIGVPPTDGAGAAGPAVDGRPTRVGQVFQVHNPALGGDQFYLLRPDGVAPVSPTAAALVLAAPATAAAYPGTAPVPVPLGPAGMTGLPVSAGTDLVDGLPTTPPVAATPPGDAVPCVRYTPGAATASVELRRRTEVDAGAVPTARHAVGTTADRVSIPGGSGVLARPAGAAGGTVLVTDVGVRFPLADDRTADALGYSGAPVTSIPPALLDLLPTGPVLSPAAALRDQAP